MPKEMKAQNDYRADGISGFGSMLRADAQKFKGQYIDDYDSEGNKVYGKLSSISPTGYTLMVGGKKPLVRKFKNSKGFENGRKAGLAKIENGTDVVTVYSTPSGAEGMKIKESTNSEGVKKYSWMGKYGAGGGLSYQDMLNDVRTHKQAHKQMKLTSGTEFEKIKNSKQFENGRKKAQDRIENAEYVKKVHKGYMLYVFPDGQTQIFKGQELVADAKSEAEAKKKITDDINK